jgi:hypothetical protein
MPEFSYKYYRILKKAWRTSLVLLFIFMVSGNVQAQEPEAPSRDTSVVDESYKLDSTYQNPHKAALYSAILPGLGQVYNKKYWKVPIVYAGFATFAYFIDFNEKGYKLWKQAYIDYPDYHNLNYDFVLTLDQIDRTKNSYKRYRDLSIIGTGAFYILQIIDATVDAYLFDWDVSEDISLKIEPSLLQTPPLMFTPASNTFALRASLSF